LKRESNSGEETVSGEIFGRRRKKVTWPDEWGPHVSEIREK
jgi:hypothetical protein